MQRQKGQAYLFAQQTLQAVEQRLAVHVGGVPARVTLQLPGRCSLLCHLSHARSLLGGSVLSQRNAHHVAPEWVAVHQHCRRDLFELTAK